VLVKFQTGQAGFGDRDVAYASGAIADVAPLWSVELHEAFPGEASLMLMPEAADDAIGPTFVLHNRAGAFQLDQYQWDIYSEIGAYGSLHDAVHAVRRKLAALTTPPSTLRH
jgi:hypothetical protein